MLPSGNDAATVLAENFVIKIIKGVLLYLESKGSFNKINNYRIIDVDKN